MPNKDGTANAWDGLKSIGIALAAAFLIALVGSSLKGGWLVMIVTPAITVAGAYFATRKSGEKTKVSTLVRWGVLGFVAGIIWFLAS